MHLGHVVPSKLSTKSYVDIVAVQNFDKKGAITWIYNKNGFVFWLGLCKQQKLITVNKRN